MSNSPKVNKEKVMTMNEYGCEFKKFIKAVGTGPKGNRDLSFEESKEAMALMLSGAVSDTQIAAFLIGWRLKPETIEEYQGALEAIIEKTRPQALPAEETFELGYPYDGKNDAPYLFPLSAKLLQHFSLTLVSAGDEKIPSKDGVTVKELMNQLKSVENFHYQDRKEFLPELTRMTALRNELGLRTALNTLEKFSGRAQSKFGATGVFHKPYVNKYCGIFGGQMQSFALFSANEGAPELYKKGRIYVFRQGDLEELTIDPADFGITTPIRDSGWSAEDMIALARSPDMNHMKLAALNSALYLYTTQQVEKWQDSYEIILGRYL